MDARVVLVQAAGQWNCAYRRRNAEQILEDRLYAHYWHGLQSGDSRAQKQIENAAVAQEEEAADDRQILCPAGR
jgi:hypothetical protein